MLHRLHRARGLTFVETLVTLAVVTVILLGLYALIDSSNKLAKQETNVAEAQQSVRIGISEVTRVIRQGRVGGLFIGNAILPVENNSSGGKFLNDLASNPHFIRRGTDVIEVRGIISGEKYGFATGDVKCGGLCSSTNAITVRIQATSGTGIVNFPTGSAPSIAGRTRPFYFVVAENSAEPIGFGAGTFLVPTYYVGLVDTTGTWYTLTPTTFTFTMDPSDGGARKLLASPPSTGQVNQPFSGGVVDQVVFFVDEGSADRSTSTLDTHPSLAEAVRDVSTGNYEVQPLIEEVEDFQLAYGVDGINGTPQDRGISPAVLDSSASNRDEWVGNFANEVATTLPLTSSDPKRVEAFLGVPPVGTSQVTAALRSVMIGLVVKSADPDFVYDGPGARGYKLLDSTAQSFSDPASTGRPYRRRVQRFAVSLRNYQ